MRVIVKISSSHNGAAGSGTRYISERDRNLEREMTSTRVLFTPEEDMIKWRGADSYLSGKSKGKPASGNLHHMILSFEEKDSRELEHFDATDICRAPAVFLFE